jgi:hypothetical protein
MGAARARATDAERMVGLLVPAQASGRPVPAPLPALPARTLPAAGAPQSLLVDTARTDRSGRVSARRLLTALGWRPHIRRAGAGKLISPRPPTACSPTAASSPASR